MNRPQVFVAVFASLLLSFTAAAFPFGAVTASHRDRVTSAAVPTSQPNDASPDAPVRFRVTFDAKLRAELYTGRVWVMTGGPIMPPISGPDWFTPSPFYALDVRDWKPDTPIEIDASAISFPGSPTVQSLRGLRVQALMQLNPDSRWAGTTPGNGRSRAVGLDDMELADGIVSLHISKPTDGDHFAESQFIKSFEMQSKLLSEFHHRKVMLRGAVILPREYIEDDTARFPTTYIFPGFSQMRDSAPMYARPTAAGDVPFVRVLLEADCATGYHEFADSKVNGPYGQALVEELIPWLETQYRLIADGQARFTTGHSSGGWASLWVQIASPDFFNGVFATAPDPVDFRNFTGVNIYKPGANVYLNDSGGEQVIAVNGSHPAITWRNFAMMEEVIGHGGQIGSFEAVFSPVDANGNALKLFDRETGEVNPAVAEAWKAYDINLILQRDWKKLEPKLKGKLHIIVGGEDTFQLQEAVKLLDTTLKSLGSDARITIVPGMDHFSLFWSRPMRAIWSEMSDRFKQTDCYKAATKPAATQPAGQ